MGKKRGFAAMSIEQRKSISSKGGKAASAKGVNHRYVAGSQLAIESGRKGGRTTAARRNAPDTIPMSQPVGCASSDLFPQG